MAEGRRGRRMNLRLFYRASGLALCLGACGCISMSIETRVERGGGGTRSYQVEMDPPFAGKDGGGPGALKISDLGLDDIQGISKVDSSHSVREDGGAVSRTTFRADDIRKFSQDDDTISLDVSRKGLWVRYRFRESYKLGIGRNDSAAAALFSKNRFRHRLRLPGRIVESNCDSMAGGWAVWNRPMFAEPGRLVMEAESRALNPIYPLLAGAALLAAAGILYGRRTSGSDKRVE